MNRAHLLSDKFTAATLPKTCAPRRELMSLFHRAASARVVYVSAPSGCGKTISTRLWLERSGREYIWIGLDEYDNSPSVFYRLLCTGLYALQPDNEAMAALIASPHFNTSPVEHTVELISAFVPNKKQYALVLDDMHLITNREILKSFFMVRKRLPGSFSTFILTRNEIQCETLDATDADRCAVLSSEQLAFSAKEIRAHFHAHGRAVTAAEAEAVLSVTTGQAVGVMALAISDVVTPERDGGQLFEHYIRSELWNNWDEQTRRFLLQTSIVSELTPPLASMLTGRHDSSEVLKTLCSQYFFVSRLGAETYRYHNLFLVFLRDMLRQYNANFIKRLYIAASEFYLEAQEIYQARQYAVKSGDPSAIWKASHALYEVGESGADLSVDEFVNINRDVFDGANPDVVCKPHPYLYSQYAGYYFLVGDAPMSEHCLDMIYKQLPRILIKYRKFLADVLLITAIDYRTSLPKTLGKLNKLPLLPQVKGRMKWSTITMQLPFVHRSIRDFCEMTDDRLLDQLDLTLTPILGARLGILPDLLRAGILFEQNLLSEARDAAEVAHRGLCDALSGEAVFSCHMHLAAIYSSLGQEYRTSRDDTIAEAEAFIGRTGASYFHPNLEAFKVRLALADGNQAAAKTWLDNYFIVETERLELYKIYQHFTTARAYLVLGRIGEAADYIARLKKLGEDFHRPLDIAEAGVLQAALQWATGQKDDALKTMEAVLVAMHQFNCVRVIAEDGAAVLPILRKLGTKARKETCHNAIPPQFLNAVTLAAHEHSTAHSGVTAHIRSDKPIKLSRQQKNMLTLLSKGYRNAEIAEQTGLTIHTVKFHMSAAYAKLDVNNAMDAVIRAKELGLLP